MLAVRSSGFPSALLVCLSAFALSGCGMSENDAPTGTPAATAVGTSVPAISLSGTPPTSVVAGNLYVFQPTASTTSGTATFSASGLPSWASFNPSTGEISGTPSSSNVGVTGEITISASDGSATTSLAPFKVDVTAPPASHGISDSVLDGSDCEYEWDSSDGSGGLSHLLRNKVGSAGLGDRRARSQDHRVRDFKSK